MDNLTEPEVRAFVGPRAGYYLNKWRAALHGTGSVTGFNWAGLLLAGIWLPYRKMYAITAIFLGIILLETILEEVVFVGILGKPEAPAPLSYGIGIAAGIICGAFGNRWYLSHARKAIAAVRSEGLSEDLHLQTLARRGGTSLAASLGIFVLFVVALFSIPFLFELVLGKGGFGERVTFGGGDEIYYTKGATEADARALGAFLRESGFFDGRNPKSVRVALDDNRVIVSFIVQEWALNNPQVQQEFRTIGQQASRQAFGGRPVVVELCDEYFNVKKRL
jgi:hypothetical protein